MSENIYENEIIMKIFLKNIIEHSILELASGEGHAMIFALRYLDYRSLV
jgi:hypothetical protein